MGKTQILNINWRSEIYKNILFPFLILIFSFLKEEQPQNIPLISLTLVVLNEDKSIYFKEEQPLNIQLILLTLIVLNEDKSIYFIEEHQ